jgi:sporulation protein YhbH
MSEMPDYIAAQKRGSKWYELFSRGARDWLRHNEKVREAVRERLPELISGADILGSDGNRTVQVPVRFLEHYRFRLSDPKQRQGAGQGKAEPGDVLRQREAPGGAGKKGSGGKGEGALEFVLELKVDDIVDWLWEELQLPNLQTKAGAVEQADYAREGWDRRGARSRLDRRRSLKESIKRRAVQRDGPVFTNEDLRFRQLVKREQPATQAVVFFSLDVSSSMTEQDRQFAKTFFFWVVQGLRRQYKRIEPVFVAHTVEAWEFSEEEFFQVRGSGGTVASKVFNKISEIIEQRFDPASYNIYIFYASDGENFSHDRLAAMEVLTELSAVTNFIGYLETSSASGNRLHTETAHLFKTLLQNGAAVGSYVLGQEADVWDAIRGFFRQQVAEQE